MRQLKACFIHQKLWNPAVLKWEFMMHYADAYEGHLTQTACDRCEKGEKGNEEKINPSERPNGKATVE